MPRAGTLGTRDFVTERRRLRLAQKTLYVGNLPYTTGESALVDAFSAYGSTNCRIIEGRGFGFVDVDADQAEAAIAAMNGASLEGRTLTVNEAKPRDDRGGSGGGGGRDRDRERTGGGGRRTW
jgi:cold-inducible RNA-binding protein